MMRGLFGGLETTLNKEPLHPLSPASATVQATSGVVLQANATRFGLTLINTSVNTISLGLGQAAVLYSGITLLAGGTWVMDNDTCYVGEIQAIASSANSNLAIQEFTNAN